LSVEPIVKRVRVRPAPARAFELFATRMGDWWPKGTTLGETPHAAIILEPHAGGRWFERTEDGVEHMWGHVLAWEPPGRLLLAWRLTSRFTYDPAFETEVELTFAPADGGGCDVTFEHRNLERFGADAERIAGQLRGGWPTRVDLFAAFADANP
jgi:uncharacterized protein YndB with AHSA1/START domain